MTGDSAQSADEVARYEGWRGDLRIIKEAFATIPGDVMEWCQSVKAKISGSATVDADACGIKDCEKKPVDHFTWSEDWRDDTPMCRRHWLFTAGIKSVLYGFGLGLLLFYAWGIYMLAVAA